MRRFHRKRKTIDTELNITAFLNLMVVLIPFLLITAAFSQITVLDLHMPGVTNNTSHKPPPVQLQMILRHQQLEVGDAVATTFTIIPQKNGLHDFANANAALQKLKAEHGNINEITLLLEEDIDYDNLIKAMDACRYSNTLINGQMIKTRLFPQISLGRAPVKSNVNAHATAGKNK